MTWDADGQLHVPIFRLYIENADTLAFEVVDTWPAWKEFHPEGQAQLLTDDYLFLIIKKVQWPTGDIVAFAKKYPGFLGVNREEPVRAQFTTTKR